MSGAFFAVLWGTSFHAAYGPFIDELYYLACARRPALGYVDHPPLAPWLLAAVRLAFGESLPAIRWVPALCGAGTVFLAMHTSWRLGGGRFAQRLTGICVASAAMYQGMFSVYSTNALEIVCWTLVFASLVSWGAGGEDPRDRRAWICVGGFVGLAVLSKHTAVNLAGALALALLLSPARGALKGPAPWVGALVALVTVAPNLLWEWRNDWASLDFYTAATQEGNLATPRLEVFAEQVGTFNPAAFPVWAAGFHFLLLSPRGRPYRIVGWTCALLFAALIAAGLSRPDRVMGIYPVLLAAGAVALEAAYRRPRLGWLHWVHPLAVVGLGFLTLPLLVPVLSPPSAARFKAALGEENEIQREVGDAKLLIALAHRMGSEELVRRATRTFDALPEAEQSHAIFLATGYPAAGAIEYFGEAHLPAVYSPHNHYYLWGPPPPTTGTVIALGFEPEQLEPWFASVEVVDRNPCEYCMGWRQDLPVSIAREPRQSLHREWSALRRYGNTIRKHYLLERQGAR